MFDINLVRGLMFANILLHETLLNFFKKYRCFVVDRYVSILLLHGKISFTTILLIVIKCNLKRIYRCLY